MLHQKGPSVVLNFQPFFSHGTPCLYFQVDIKWLWKFYYYSQYMTWDSKEQREIRKEGCERRYSAQKEPFFILCVTGNRMCLFLFLLLPTPIWVWRAKWFIVNATSLCLRFAFVVQHYQNTIRDSLTAALATCHCKMNSSCYNNCLSDIARLRQFCLEMNIQ